MMLYLDNRGAVYLRWCERDNTYRTNTQLTHLIKSMIQIKTTAIINMLSIDSEVLVILRICIE